MVKGRDWNERPLILKDHLIQTPEEAEETAKWISSMKIEQVWVFARQMDKGEEKDSVLISSSSGLKRCHAYAFRSSAFVIDDFTIACLKDDEPLFARALMRAFMCLGIPGAQQLSVDGDEGSINGRWKLAHGNEVNITNYSVCQSEGQLMMTVNAETTDIHVFDGVARWILVVSKNDASSESGTARFFVIGAGSHPLRGYDVVNVAMSGNWWENVGSTGVEAMNVLSHCNHTDWHKHVQEIIDSGEFSAKFEGRLGRSLLLAADMAAGMVRRLRRRKIEKNKHKN